MFGIAREMITTFALGDSTKYPDLHLRLYIAGHSCCSGSVDLRCGGCDVTAPREFINM